MYITKKEIKEKRESYLESNKNLLQQWGAEKPDSFFKKIIKKDIEKHWTHNKSWDSGNKHITQQINTITNRTRFIVKNRTTGKSYIRKKKSKI